MNADEPEAQYGSTNDTTLKPVNDIMDNNSSIEIEKKSNEYGYNLYNLNYSP